MLIYLGISVVVADAKNRVLTGIDVIDKSFNVTGRS